MISVVITGAGSSTRFGKNKMLELLGGKPLILRTLEPFLQCSSIDELVIAVKKQDINIYCQLIEENIETKNPIKIVEGGQERIISLYKGIEASIGEYIIAHDGARPLTSLKLIEDLIAAVEDTGAAMTAIPPVATMKAVESSMIISESFVREKTWIAQTPQMFRREIIEKALKRAITEKYFIPTDDSEIVAKMTNCQVKVVPGDPVNMKVTLPLDLVIANALFKVRSK